MHQRGRLMSQYGGRRKKTKERKGQHRRHRHLHRRRHHHHQRYYPFIQRVSKKVKKRRPTNLYLFVSSPVIIIHIPFLLSYSPLYLFVKKREGKERKEEGSKEGREGEKSNVYICMYVCIRRHTPRSTLSLGSFHHSERTR